MKLISQNKKVNKPNKHDKSTALGIGSANSKKNVFTYAFSGRTASRPSDQDFSWAFSIKTCTVGAVLNYSFRPLKCSIHHLSCGTVEKITLRNRTNLGSAKFILNGSYSWFIKIVVEVHFGFTSVNKRGFCSGLKKMNN